MVADPGQAGRGPRRLLGRLLGRRRQAPAGLDADRTDLLVVVSGSDDAEACSTTLERAASTAPRWDATAPALLRHHLLLPAPEVAEAVATAGQDGYRRIPAIPPPEAPLAADVAQGDEETLVLARVQLLDALHCSQERSRMAGLAQRRGGRALGWDGLQAPPLL